MSSTTEKVTAKSLVEGRSDIRRVKPTNIVAEPGFNARNPELAENKKHVEELMYSIKENGQHMPVKAFFDSEREKYVLVDGHCRHAAITKIYNELVDAGKQDEAEKVTVDVIAIKKSEASEEGRIFTMLTSNQSKSFTPTEMGAAYLRLVNIGWTVKEIAKKVGVSYTKVNNLVLVANAPKALQNLIADSQIGYTTVIKLFRETNDWDETTAKIMGIKTQMEAALDGYTELEDDGKVESDVKAPVGAGEKANNQHTQKPKTTDDGKVKISAKDVLEDEPQNTNSSKANRLQELIDGLETIENDKAELVYNTLLMFQDSEAKVKDIVNYVVINTK